MTKKQLVKRVNFKPKKFEYTEEVHYSSKLTPYQDNERDFCGYFRCTSNVLGAKDYDTALAMCKDAK